MLRQITVDDCVSAAEVVCSVARFVPRPDSFAAPTAPTEYLAKIDFHLWQWKVREAFCEAEAGAQINALLLNARDEAPLWFAWDDSTALPIIDDKARDDGHRILRSLTTYCKSLLNAPLQTPSSPTWMQELPKRDEHDGDSRRLEHIGFIREEIAAFFDNVGIPHSLASGLRPGVVVLSHETTAPEAPVRRDRVGKSDELVARRIEESIAAARAKNPDIRDLPKEDAAVIKLSWEVFKGWALDMESASGTAPPAKNPHYPIIGYDSRAKKVLFDGTVWGFPMSKPTFAKRIDPTRRDRKKVR